MTWDELPDVETEDFTLATMPKRFAKLGDVQANMDEAVCDLPGEPKRVQPSRARPEEPEPAPVSKSRRRSRRQT